jgi:uncharacterized membrane protein
MDTAASLQAAGDAPAPEPVPAGKRPAGPGAGDVSLTHLTLAAVAVSAGAGSVALHAESFLTEPLFRGSLLPRETWLELSYWAQSRPAAWAVLGGLLTCWPVGALILAVLRRENWRRMAWLWGLAFFWLSGLGLFELAWSVAGARAPRIAAPALARLLDVLTAWHVVAWGGWLGTAFALAMPFGRLRWLARLLAARTTLGLAALAFAAVFALLSIAQYRALLVPHGDSAMYEEHLWNLLHGKGFRSQLDGGRLFLGEHLEVIHVLLLPVYALWPCLPMLNIIQCLAVGAGAIAVRGLGRRLTDSDAAANALAVAYLLYYPMQYLLLEASLKTYRPEHLAVPLILFALWALEAERWRTMLVLLGLALLAKEDYAIVTGSLGLFLALRRGKATQQSRMLGAGLAAFSAVYLWFVLQVFIPYFRGGPPHYAAYFAELGSTPAQIVGNLVRHPGFVLQRLARWPNLVFALALVMPLALLPLFGLGRLWVLVPSLNMLLLSDREGMNTPLFHFHAPLVPMLFWSAAAGMGRLGRWLAWTVRLPAEANRVKPGDSPAEWARSGEIRTATAATTEVAPPVRIAAARVACLAIAGALVSGFWQGKSPLSLTFYNPHSGMQGFGLLLYGVNPRMASFQRLYAAIPADASVAATDYVRPRFTHHRACHQWGAGGLKPHVLAADIDYIVIDLLGPNSDPATGLRAAELLPNPQQWTVAYRDPMFLVLAQHRDSSNR